MGRTVLLLVTGFLAGCSEMPDVSLGAAGIGFLNRAPERISVANQSVVIAGPPGYCVDNTVTRNSDDGSFVLLGSCAAIANSVRMASPAIPGLLTASVSGRNAAEITNQTDALKSFFESSAGHAALARDGNAGSVTILDAQTRDGAVYLHVRDQSNDRTPGLAADYWRGLFGVNGRIVTVTVVGFESQNMTDAAGLATLNAFATRIRLENPTVATTTPAL